MSVDFVERERVILRDYSKVIFFYPLFLVSFFAWIVQFWQEKSGNDGGAPISWLSILWVTVFFANLFVVAFDFNAGKTLVLFLAIVTVGLIIGILYATGKIAKPTVDTEQLAEFNMGIKASFYGIITIMLALILLFVLLEGQFKYIKIEQNEVYIKGIQGKAERFPTSNLRIRMEISDVFEYLALKAGTIVLYIPNQEPIFLHTIINVKKREQEIDKLLSTTRVESVKPSP